MGCQDYKELMMGYLDDELDALQKKAFEEHISTCGNCKEEVEEFRHLKRITDEVTLAEPEDRIWNQYWGNVYNRIERGVGWIIFSIAAIILIMYGGFKAIEAILMDPAVEIILKVGLLALIAGLAVLLVSIMRERLYFWKKDRYKDIRR
ncbi:MAG: zf-HC2 domain-containing protein [Candidatus Brocadiia bacterium]|nr:MAG: zf-HC2 domain-containing protein [Candidatus Brocadiia bacterium]